MAIRYHGIRCYKREIKNVCNELHFEAVEKIIEELELAYCELEELLNDLATEVAS